MSLGKTGIIRPENEKFFSDQRYLLIHPDEMKPGACAIQDCREYQPLVMFIGGAKDDKYGNVLKYIFDPYNRAHEGDQDIGYGTFQTGSAIAEIAREWHKKGQKICLIGHSYGGDTAMDVARKLGAEDIALELVVTLDPVGRSGPTADQPKPIHLARWLNVYVDYESDASGKCDTFTPNGIAILGGPWQYCANADNNAVYRFSDACLSHAQADQMFKLFGYEHEVAKIR